MAYVDWTSERFRAAVAERPAPADMPCRSCGHARSAHYGYGPCLVAISGLTGREFDATAKASPHAPGASNCPCPIFHRAIGPLTREGSWRSSSSLTGSDG